MVTDTDFKVRAAVLGADSDVYIDLLEQACVCVCERESRGVGREREVGGDRGRVIQDTEKNVSHSFNQAASLLLC